MDTIFQFMPIFLMQAVYSVFTYKVAEKTGKNRALYVFLTLIPLIGSLFFIYVMLSSIIYLLDKVNKA